MVKVCGQRKSKMRYDNLDHWVEFDKKKSRSRCKLVDCNGFTHGYCTKCMIYLCCSVNRNCFRKFHQPESAWEKPKPVKCLKQQSQKLTKGRRQEKADNHKNISLSHRARCDEKAEESSDRITRQTSFKNVKSTMKPKGEQWNSNFCQEYVQSYSLKLSNQCVGTLAKDQIMDSSRQMLETESRKRQNRRKSSHQVKPISDESLEYIEIVDQN